MSRPNTFGILLPKLSAPAISPTESANPPVPLENAAGPVASVEAAANVAAEALAADPATAERAAQAAAILALADMIPGTPGPTPPSQKTVRAFLGGIGGGFDGGQVDGHGNCTPCKIQEALQVGNPVNAVLGIKVLSGENEVDFALDAPLPLVWQRSYFSDIPSCSWLGHGWTLPFSPTITRVADGFLYTDEQGREIFLPDCFDHLFANDDRTENDQGDNNSPDTVFFDPYEQIAFSRPAQHLYRIASADGSSSLLFAPLNSGDEIYRIVALCGRNGNHNRIVYTDNGLPRYIYDSAGRIYRLDFISTPLIQTDPDFSAAEQSGAFTGKDGRIYVNRLGSVTLLSDGVDTVLVSYTYNEYGDLSAVYGLGGCLLREFTYRNHILTEHRQPDGLAARYRYDQYTPKGRVLLSEDNLGQRWTFDYRSGHTIVTDVFGRTTEYGFDHNREHIYTIDADGRRTDTERDDYGRIILQRDPLGRETRYLYDTYGNLLAVTAPDGSRTAIGYEDENNDSLPTEITQPDGSLTRYEYDADGNLIAEIDALGHTTHYTYDRRGLPVGITDPLGKSKTLVYDEAGQLTAYTDCSGQTTRFAYTTLGEIETVTDALDQTTRYHYDEYGNHIRTDHPDGGSEHFVYDALNRLTGHTDPLGGQTRYTLDKDGLPKERTDALGNRFSYTYDAARRLTRLTNENGEHYLLDYDNADRLVRETGWDGKITAYAYDAAGQLSQQTEYGCLKDTDRRNGQHPGRTALPEIWHIHHFTRNLLGQLVEKTSRKIEKNGSRHKDHGAVRTRFDYDPAGNMGSHRLIRARNRHSSLEYTYDALGRITRETLTHNGRQTGIAYQYDANGNRLQTTLPDGQQISTLYYGSGHLHHIALDGQTIADIERDRLHRETQRTQGTLVSRFDYDPMGRLQRQSAGRQGTPHPGPLVERRYRYDKAGNLIGSTDLRSGTTDYTYDKLGRILEAANAGRNTKEKFAFDPAGNILDELARNAREGSLYRPSGNRIAEFNGTRYQYDPLGNLIYRELPDGESQLFEYDTENQLIGAKLYKPDGEVQQWQYAYDPFGRRISKERIDKGSLHSTDPKRTVFIWDGSRLC